MINMDGHLLQKHIFNSLEAVFVFQMDKTFSLLRKLAKLNAKKKAPFIKENQQNVLNCVDFNYKVFTNTILHNITGFSNIVVNAAAI